MAANPATYRRKYPKQARARATVDAILEAAARVLVAEGEERATTNRIAEVAGVSIGSLYQYFPNKHSLVLALFERHLEQAEAMRPDALRPGSDIPLAERMRLAVRWHLAVHALDPALHRVLTRIAPLVLGPDALCAFERMHQRAVHDALAPYAAELRPARLELAAFVVSQCLEALTHGAVVHHPELLGDGALEDEIAALLLGYLSPLSPASAPAP